MSSPAFAAITNRLNTDPYAPSAAAVTMGDVINRSLVLLSATGIAGVAGWTLAQRRPGLAMSLAAGAGLAAMALSFVLALWRRAPVVLFFVFAGLEGVALGATSSFFEARYPGIVRSAVLATATLFAVVLAGYRLGLIRVTSRAVRVFMFAMLGYLAFTIVASVLVHSGVMPGLGRWGLLVSVVAIALGAYSLAIDFDSISNAVNARAPQRASWSLAYGLLVSLVWLYVEFLRLFLRLADTD